MSRLTNLAKAEAARYTSDLDGFGVPVTFTSPAGMVVEINCRATKHHTQIDPTTGGLIANTRFASVTFSEQLLVTKNYPVRNQAGEVNLKGHAVKWADSTGEVREYLITQWFPDETLGLIACPGLSTLK